MKILNSIFVVLIGVGFAGCGSSTEKKVDKANDYIAEMNSLVPTINQMARTDLRSTSTEQRADMKNVLSDYLRMADYVINVANRDDVYYYGIDDVRTQMNFVSGFLATIENYENGLEVESKQNEINVNN